MGLEVVRLSSVILDSGSLISRAISVALTTLPRERERWVTFVLDPHGRWPVTALASKCPGPKHYGIFKANPHKRCPTSLLLLQFPVLERRRLNIISLQILPRTGHVVPRSILYDKNQWKHFGENTSIRLFLAGRYPSFGFSTIG